ncbi:MAG TPA: hypothetical protein PKM25_11770, partial [Candidatus Ozemobacteraceae bacterium]|nr:hypothetical protein [Candidatus Ozemobacteraceae bacterium]
GTDEEGIMCVHQDMTGIGWRMEDLSRSLARSEMRARQSIQHVVRLSREMCEPLERMAAYCDKLEGSQLTEDQRGWLLSLRDNARLLEKHIRRSIDLSVVSDDEEGGVVPARMEPLVGEVCDLYLGMTREKGLTLSMHVGSELAAPVYVDAVKVRQILVNMMDSAVRQARSGDIAVTASLVPGSDRPLCLKIRIGNPRPGTGGTMPKISMGLSHVIIKGLCGMTGGRFETGIAPDGSRLMKVCLRLSPPVSSEGAGR